MAARVSAGSSGARFTCNARSPKWSVAVMKIALAEENSGGASHPITRRVRGQTGRVTACGVVPRGPSRGEGLTGGKSQWLDAPPPISRLENMAKDGWSRMPAYGVAARRASSTGGRMRARRRGEEIGGGSGRAERPAGGAGAAETTGGEGHPIGGG
eukprot:scaffold19184_cov112-Isochrysis_galbana.AAC.5